MGFSQFERFKFEAGNNYDDIIFHHPVICSIDVSSPRLTSTVRYRASPEPYTVKAPAHWKESVGSQWWGKLG